MPEKFPDLKPGDELTSAYLNAIVAELRRWRRLSGSGLVDVDGADGSSPPRIVGHESIPIITVLLASGIAAGSYTSPSTATATIMRPLYTSGGGYESTGDTETIYNVNATAIGSGKITRAFREIDGKLQLLVSDC